MGTALPPVARFSVFNGVKPTLILLFKAKIG